MSSARVAIVGAGIAGLALAEALKRQGGPSIEVSIFERNDRAGGNIHTVRHEGYLCEDGPNGFLDNAPATLALVDRLGMSKRLLPSSDATRHRFVFVRGALREIPTSPLAFARSNILSMAGKMRILGEPFAKTRADEDESIHAFAERRIGAEAAAVLVDPMVSGVFAGDAEALSLHACFPTMWDMETQYGSLVRAMIAKRREKRLPQQNGIGAPAGRLTSFVGGMQDLVDGLIRHLGPMVRLRTPVVGIRRLRGEAAPFAVDLDHMPSVHADVVVLAGPSGQSAELVRSIDAPLAAAIGAIPTVPVAVVSVGLERKAVPRSLDGFGFLVPRGEGPRVLGVLWDSSIYPGRAPIRRVLLRAMLGGALDPEAAALPDDQLIRIVRSDLARTMGIADAPVFSRIVRHRVGMPQYTIGHLTRLARIESFAPQHPGLFVGGNSYRGVAMNSCIADAEPLAGRVLATIHATGHSEGSSLKSAV